jgi:hypothetical protein
MKKKLGNNNNDPILTLPGWPALFHSREAKPWSHYKLGESLIWDQCFNNTTTCTCKFFL